MKLRSRIVLYLVAGVGLLLIAHRWQRLQRAEARLDAARARLNSTEREARQMTELAAARPRAALHRRPTNDLLAQINQTLADAALPGACLQGLAPESDLQSAGAAGAGAGGDACRIQTVRLALTGLTLPQFGAFLHHWRQRGALWTPVRLELTTSARRRDRGRDAVPFDITLRLAARYLADEPGGST